VQLIRVTVNKLTIVFQEYCVDSESCDWFVWTASWQWTVPSSGDAVCTVDEYASLHYNVALYVFSVSALDYMADSDEPYSLRC
jgi:hypothetical protein